MENLIGKKIVGYRYGKAPESGKSYNHRNNRNECGVSMAKIGHMSESKSLAVQNLKDKNVKRYYYIGTISGEGGDDEICLTDISQITYKEFLIALKDREIINTSNAIVDFFADRKIELIDAGYNILKTKNEVNEWRNKQIK